MASTISSDESELDLTSIRKARCKVGRLSISTSELDSYSSVDRQRLGLRAKKYLVPRLLSQRKVLMGLLHPLVAAALNDIHYLLKAHMSSKERFLKLDRAILRMLIKVGVVAQEYEASVMEMTAVCRIEELTKQFLLLFIAFSRCEKPLDIDALIGVLQQLQNALLFLAQRVFSEKSMKRIHFIFTELSSRDLWNSVYSPEVTAEQRQLLLNLTASFDRVLSSNLL